MPMTPKEMLKYLKKNGFVIERQRGSHIFLVNNKTDRKTTVAYHNKGLRKGTEQQILKDAGLKQP